MTDTNVVSTGEVWKDVPGFEPFYQVSNLGRVKSKDRWSPINGGLRFFAGKMMKLSLNHYGYLHVSFTINGKGKCINAHQLVAWAFFGEQLPGIQVNHIDGNKQNNSINNLEYVTNSQNIQHACDTGLFNNKKRMKTCRFSDEQIIEIRQLLTNGASSSEVGRQYNCSAYEIEKIGRHERYTWVLPVKN